MFILIIAYMLSLFTTAGQIGQAASFDYHETKLTQGFMWQVDFVSIGDADKVIVYSRKQTED